MADCIFCKMTKKEISSEIIYEDDFTLGVLDVNPRSLGHTMILPKIHAENILDLPDEHIGPVFQAVKQVTELLKKCFNPDGFTIGINHGRASGQVVDHLHIHIMPRWSDDRGEAVQSLVNNQPKESLEEIKNRILGARL